MRKKMNGGRGLSQLIIYVVLSALAISIVVPVAWVFMASLRQDNEFYGSPWTLPAGLHFQNFADAWGEARMGEYFLSSVLVTGMGIILLLALALPAAYALSRFRFRGHKVTGIFLMAGLFINMNYIVVPIFLMFVDADKALRTLFGGPFFMNNLFILALVYASTALPFTIYLLTGYLSTLPKEFEEAAYVDGAGYFATMIKVIMPMAKPSIVTVILFNFLFFWNEYILSMTLLTEMNGNRTLPVGLMNLMKAGKAAAHFGQMYAGLVMVMLPTLILYIFVQKKLTQGMTVGGLKG
ncbi:MAG: carbohydrate ABC transporter permease [Lachnospiraceae bacterium]|jgi:N-acetylglucosamine transport system permease protein|nr:carbohydrate ABC transporter permease [Lachnospiraceae bacterium]